MSKHTPGPWAWYGNSNSNSIFLGTVHGGRKYVMDFVRWGMQGAQPRFQPDSGMIDAKDLVKFAVGDKSITGVEQAKKDTSVYRYDISGIDCPDARLIALSPQMYDYIKSRAELGDEEAIDLVAKAQGN